MFNISFLTPDQKWSFKIHENFQNLEKSKDKFFYRTEQFLEKLKKTTDCFFEKAKEVDLFLNKKLEKTKNKINKRISLEKKIKSIRDYSKVLDKRYKELELNWPLISEIRKLVKSLLKFISFISPTHTKKLSPLMSRLGLFSFISLFISTLNVQSKIKEVINKIKIKDLEGSFIASLNLILHLVDLVENFSSSWGALVSIGLVIPIALLETLTLPISIILLSLGGLIKAYIAAWNAIEYRKINTMFERIIQTKEDKTLSDDARREGICREIKERIHLTDPEKIKITNDFTLSFEKRRKKLNRICRNRVEFQKEDLIEKIRNAKKKNISEEIRQKMESELAQLEDEAKFNLLVENKVKEKLDKAFTGKNSLEERLKSAEQLKCDKLALHTDRKIVNLMKNFLQEKDHKKAEEALPIMHRDIKIILATELAINSTTVVLNTAALTALIASSFFGLFPLAPILVSLVRGVHKICTIIIKRFIVDEFLELKEWNQPVKPPIAT